MDSSLAIEMLKDIVQILVLAWVLYKLYLAIQETKLTQLIMVLCTYAMGYGVCYILDFDFLLMLYAKVTLPLLAFLCIIFHSEFRRVVSMLFSGRTRFFRIGQQTTGEQIDSILNACNILVEKKRGALIVFPRHIDIKSVLDSGTKLNADLSSTLILTIFDHDTPLHDGACVVQGGRITYAACYLPLSEQTGIKASFGTRHRAALGLAEVSDAVIIVVSEETGAISLAYNANIYYDLTNDTIKKVLLALFTYRDVLPSEIKEQSGSSDGSEGQLKGGEV